MNALTNIDLGSLSQDELTALIASAQQTVLDRQKAKRGEVTAQIEELARSIGAKVTFEYPDTKSSKASHGNIKKEVAAKFRNPNNADQTWTGRGLPPKWMQELVAQGRNKDEFLIAS